MTEAHRDTVPKARIAALAALGTASPRASAVGDGKPSLASPTSCGARPSIRWSRCGATQRSASPAR